jgi:hypothetical protein
LTQESIKINFGFSELWKLQGKKIPVSKHIQETIFATFGIHIEAEVNVI